MKGWWLAVLAAALGCAGTLSCATLGEPPPPSGPPAFAGVKKVALVRVRTDRDAPRAKDALDALAESLAARGYEVTRVELGARPPAELRGVERLYARVDGSIASAQPRPRYARPLESAGSGAGEVVRSLGVDAVAMYHRFDDRLLAPLQDPPLGGGFFGPPRVESPAVRRPAGAISLVDGSGNATWFAWGSPGSELDPTEPVNAAEAIDMALRALRGETGDELEGG
ncbi:MAG TPA: hypothetical protein VFK90_11055 [Anaeromyxobacter sp.]|nr:hypothetical protein [Anaeromyxobacter sp.]